MSLFVCGIRKIYGEDGGIRSQLSFRSVATPPRSPTSFVRSGILIPPTCDRCPPLANTAHMVRTEGFEPSTNRLRAGCSTTELRPQTRQLYYREVLSKAVSTHFPRKKVITTTANPTRRCSVITSKRFCPVLFEILRLKSIRTIAE